MMYYYYTMGWIERVDVAHIDHDVFEEDMNYDGHTENQFLIGAR